MRRYLIFITAGLSLLMNAIDSTVVAVAFPNFTRELHTNVLWSAWTISIFFIAVTMTMPLAGNLSDSFGRKKVFLYSLILFTGSSVACGLAPNIAVLIAFRFLQGVGGACFLPTASGIVSDHFPESRQTAIGLFSSIYNIGAIIGPNLGGWLVSRYSWRYIFYINLPIGILLIISIMILLEDSRGFSRPHVDVAGASLMSGALLFLMFGLNLIGESLFALSLILAGIFLLLGFSLGFLFFRREKRTAYPILDITLLQSRPFLAANLSNLVLGVVLFGLFSFIPLYAISVHNLSTLMSGMILTPRSVGIVAVAAVTSFLLKKWGYRWPMIWGFALISFATILLAPGLLPWAAIAAQERTVEMLSFLLLLTGIGGGIAIPASNNACIELMPEKIGTIVGLRNMFRNVGGAIGVSLVTFILHLSADPAKGFRITFISFGLAFLLSIPLVLVMPDGKKA